MRYVNLIKWESVDNGCQITGITGKLPCFDINCLDKQISSIRGSFALLWECNDFVVIAADAIRSIPIYYFVKDGIIITAENAVDIIKYTKSPIDEENAREFLKCSYVTGEQTIIKDCFTVLPGSYVKISKIDGTIKKCKYYEIKFNLGEYGQKADLERIDKIFVDVFKDIASLIKGRTAVIPLSGGLDSRTVVTMLKRCGHDAIICVSYGRKDSSEVAIARKVAKGLGVRWLYVEYTKERWKRFFQSEEYKRFLLYTGRGDDIGCLQAVPAFAELMEKHEIPEDAVVIPGHALDFLFGSHIPRMEREERWPENKLINYIFEHHYFLNRNIKAISKKKVNAWGKIGEETNRSGVCHFIMDWEWKNRQSKFIANDVRSYEFFGLQFLLPFWDLRLIDALGFLSYEELYGRKLQYMFTEKYINRYIGLLPQFDMKSGFKNTKQIFKQIMKSLSMVQTLIRLTEQGKIRFHNSNVIFDWINMNIRIKYLMKYGRKWDLNSIVSEDTLSMIKEMIHEASY